MFQWVESLREIHRLEGINLEEYFAFLVRYFNRKKYQDIVFGDSNLLKLMKDLPISIYFEENANTGPYSLNDLYTKKYNNIYLIEYGLKWIFENREQLIKERKKK